MNETSLKHKWGKLLKDSCDYQIFESISIIGKHKGEHWVSININGEIINNPKFTENEVIGLTESILTSSRERQNN